jgi:hypothetical protein
MRNSEQYVEERSQSGVRERQAAMSRSLLQLPYEMLKLLRTALTTREFQGTYH